MEFYKNHSVYNVSTVSVIAAITAVHIVNRITKILGVECQLKSNSRTILIVKTLLEIVRCLA
jgi:hypothetical protein